MAKSADESLKEVIGTFVVQNVQLQAIATQLAEEKAALEEKVKQLEALGQGTHLKAVKSKE